MDEAQRLRQRRTIATEKKKICANFLSKFQLDEKDLDRIRSSEYAIDEKFFSALEKVEEIRQNCRLISESGSGTASSLIEGGFGSMAAGGGASDMAQLLNQTSAFDILQVSYSED